MHTPDLSPDWLFDKLSAVANVGLKYLTHNRATLLNLILVPVLSSGPHVFLPYFNTPTCSLLSKHLKLSFCMCFCTGSNISNRQNIPAFRVK
mmetsp:Transcript_63395/g.94062  ORF Transcript_63395/g.94062 Transcript_63395/m.94062 type:complete len:92 (-) Transcript_63395:61-336(-)